MKFRKWLLKLIIGFAKYEDKNDDGIIELTVSYDIHTKKISWGIK